MGRKSRTLPLRQRAQKAAEFTQAAFFVPSGKSALRRAGIHIMGNVDKTSW